MKLEFKITPENSYLIDNILAGIQKGCSKRLLCYEEIQKSAEIAESLIERILNKKNRQNVCALVTPDYNEFPIYYRGTPYHTQCVIRRGSKHWYVSEFERVKANRAGSFRVTVDTESLKVKKDSIFECVTQDLRSDHVI